MLQTAWRIRKHVYWSRSVLFVIVPKIGRNSSSQMNLPNMIQMLVMLKYKNLNSFILIVIICTASCHKGIVYRPQVAYETKVLETGQKCRKHIVGTNRIKLDKFLPLQHSEKISKTWIILKVHAVTTKNCNYYSIIVSTVMIQCFRTPKKCVVITLKFELCGSAIE